MDRNGIESTPGLSVPRNRYLEFELDLDPIVDSMVRLMDNRMELSVDLWILTAFRPMVHSDEILEISSQDFWVWDLFRRW